MQVRVQTLLTHTSMTIDGILITFTAGSSFYLASSGSSHTSKANEYCDQISARLDSSTATGVTYAYYYYLTSINYSLLLIH